VHRVEEHPRITSEAVGDMSEHTSQPSMPSSTVRPPSRGVAAEAKQVLHGVAVMRLQRWRGEAALEGEEGGSAERIDRRRWR
jgi:hypothetical protein